MHLEWKRCLIIIIIIIIININAMVKNKEQVNKLESEAGEG